MTSYCPQTRYAQQPDVWLGGQGVRFATPEEAQASLARLIATRDDLLETRIVESTHKPTDAWVIAGNGEGYAIPRGRQDRDDKRGKFTKRGKNRSNPY